MNDAFEDIVVEISDLVGTITLNRPNVRNALRSQTYRELTRAVLSLADSDEVGVIVLRGAGDEAFCAGGDINEQLDRDPAGARSHLRGVLALGQAMRGCGKPVVAAVRGYCVGGGHELHLMADLTISGQDGVFGQTGPRVGGVPVWGATQSLVLVVGEKRAREMIFTTRFYSADEALQMGLINRVVPNDEFEEGIRSFCEELLTKSPQSLRIAKTSMNFLSDSLWPGLTHGVELLATVFGTEEQQEGVNAFLEKRKPDYRGIREKRAEAAGATGTNHEG